MRDLTDLPPLLSFVFLFSRVAIKMTTTAQHAAEYCVIVVQSRTENREKAISSPRKRNEMVDNFIYCLKDWRIRLIGFYGSFPRESQVEKVTAGVRS